MNFTSKEEVLAWIQSIEENASKDYCMCGSPVEHSAWLAGHTPVSEYDYYMYEAQEELAKW